jgi:predicted O-linked N-acetylglucosamine transferase (SPINDLY family)
MELIATTREAYFEAAVAASQKLAEYRRTLRRRMLESPLTDAVRFARDFSDAIVGVHGR